MNEEYNNAQDNSNPLYNGIINALQLMRPAAVLGIKGLLELGEKTKTLTAYAREEFEDLVAEAQFERMKQQIDEEQKE